MKYKCLISVLSTFLAFIPVFAQTKPEANPNRPGRFATRATAYELKQALDAADRFVKRLRETRDLTPLVREMFSSDFAKLIAEDTTWSGIVAQPIPLVENLKGEDRIRCYAVAFTLDYLVRLFLAGKLPWDSTRLLREVWTPEMERHFRDDNQPFRGKISNAEQARVYLSFLEQGLVIFQNELRKNPPEETEQFRTNLVSFEKHSQQVENEQPSVWISTIAEHGRPAGTLFAKVILPFHVGVLMVKEEEQFKIWLALSTLRPD